MDVLVIDDAQERLRWFQDTLESAGHQVRLADTPDAALDQLREVVFDVAFFDHDLGAKMSGSQLATHIFRHPKRFKTPKAVWVHSSNTVGAENIASKCRSAGLRVGMGSFESFMHQPKLLHEALAKLVQS